LDKTINVAIDGPAGAGKSTIAREVSKRLGFIYIDTGAMYRAVALYAILNDIDTKDKESICLMLPDINIDIKHDNGSQSVFLNGKDVTDSIRNEDVSVAASNVAVIPEVRLKLLDLQRQLAQKHSVIMDGRDIGTYVLPNADIKVFLTASAKERAGRRYLELTEKGQKCDFEDVLKDMEYRDKNDSTREFAPLKQADDAIIIDTTDYNLENSINIVYNAITERL
jgi:cytidylate kinase